MIEIRDLQKVIDGEAIVDVPALDVRGGEIAALVGAVDSGKEIMLTLMTGQLRPTAGTVRLAGIDPYVERAKFSRQVGILFADDNLYKRQSALGNLRFFCRLHRLPRTRVDEVLTLVGLLDHADIPVEKLSSSLMRRLSLGRAILHNPVVLLLDEPFARCDEATVSLFGKIMRQLAGNGVALLVLAQDVTQLIPLCTVIHRLEHGRIVETYKPAEVQRPDLPFMIPAKPEGKVVLVAPGDILFVVAQDDRAYLQTADALLPTQFTLADLEKRLARSGFFRAHRGYLVNLQYVKEVIPYTRDSYSLRLKDANRTEIPLSKAAAQEFRELLGY